MLSVINAECRTQACNAECRKQEYYAECRYDECHYAECRYTKCCGTFKVSLLNEMNTFKLVNGAPAN
jgi:hypothetical protein